MKLIKTLLIWMLLTNTLLILSACTVFPEPVAEEMQEDPNPQTNNFL